MLKGDSYSMLLNHIEHKVKQISVSETMASFEVTVLDDKKRYYKFNNWNVCWNLIQYEDALSKINYMNRT